MALRDEQDILLNLICIDTSRIRRIKVLPAELVFSDYQPEGEFLSPISGIRKYGGPYDVNTSDQAVARKFNGIEFYVFYPKGQSRVFERLKMLIGYLRNGYFEKRTKNDVEFRGLKEEFRLKDVFVPEPKEFREYEPGRLNDEIKSIDYNEAFQRGNIPVAIIGGVSHRSVRVNRELYLEAKMEFTKRNIASQYASFYEYRTGGLGILCKVADKNSPFGFSLWNFALNIYGKSGGLAWVVRQRLSEKCEETIDLTIGLRFVKVPGDQRVSKERYHMGYAIILDRFGRLVGVVSSEPFQISTEMLKTSGMVVPSNVMKNIIMMALEKAISDSRFKEIFNVKPVINIAIHRLSIFNQEEISAISSAIKSQMGEKTVKFGLVSIMSTRSLLFFNKIDNRISADRNTAITLNNDVALMYTVEAETKVAYPITIRVQNLGKEESVFKTLEEACNHVSALSALHWQTVIPGSIKLPAPLEFARGIAWLSLHNILPQKDSWLWKTLWFI